MVRKSLFIFVLSLLGAFAATAQDYEEYYRFAEEAKEKSMIFRGKQGISYNFLYNGTYFWYGTDFQKGDVFYNGKLYRDLLVNVNAHRQYILVRRDEGMVPVMVETDHVDWFTMGGRMYVNLRKGGNASVPEGFFEVLYDGNAKLYKRIDKVLSKDANNRNGYSIGYEDPNYKTSVLDYFSNRVTYWFVKDGRTCPLKSTKRWQKVASKYPESKKDIKRFVASSGLSGAGFETVAPAILEFVENE